MGGLELAQEIARLAEEYNQAVAVVERNNHGSGILAYLSGVCRYPRVYINGDGANGNRHGDGDGQPGWLTTQITRPRMVGLLAAALVETPGIFCSRRLLKECRTFVRHRNGKVAAQYGEHDDCVMAMAMALSVRSELLMGGEGKP